MSERKVWDEPGFDRHFIVWLYDGTECVHKERCHKGGSNESLYQTFMELVDTASPYGVAITEIWG